MKYIDPSKLIEVVDASRAENPHADLKMARNHRLEHEHFIRMIVRAPAEDVAPVVHAAWVRRRVTDKAIVVDEVCCSRCFNIIGVVFSDTGFEECKTGHNFCSKCGARMDAEGF